MLSLKERQRIEQEEREALIIRRRLEEKDTSELEKDAWQAAEISKDIAKYGKGGAIKRHALDTLMVSIASGFLGGMIFFYFFGDKNDPVQIISMTGKGIALFSIYGFCKIIKRSWKVAVKADE